MSEAAGLAGALGRWRACTASLDMIDRNERASAHDRPSWLVARRLTERLAARARDAVPAGAARRGALYARPEPRRRPGRSERPARPRAHYHPHAARRERHRHLPGRDGDGPLPPGP